ncbi:hypothetical protein SAMN05216275_10367 [Streptosporangium canum]|uniref:Uncharacterized protein n=1 Tax=Streptosporangium canum TaxID=324952 RepID=A0A1I3HYK4_9ACTN|nr:hypothetical protein [Streptosporangium canum]SFI40761.1 hypothetical protein SAMN05216275_10367 [Streptosporangium canum]
MTAGLDSIGFDVLGVPRPPDTTELERQAGALESAAGSRRSLGDDGARAHRLGAGNAGIANDALDEHVAGKAGLLSRTTAQTQHVSVAASVSQIATTVVKWAGGLLAGLAGLAGLAALTPQGRAMLALRLRPFAHRVQGWIRAAMQSVGRLFTRLADLVRGTTAKQRVGQQLTAEQRLMSTQWQRTVAERAKAAERAKIIETRTVKAKISAGRATESIDRAGKRLRSAESDIRNARTSVKTNVDAAYARGEIHPGHMAYLKSSSKPLANNFYLDEMTSIRLYEQATQLKGVEAQLGRHTATHLDDAQRHVDEGLAIARTHRMDAPDLYRLQDEVAELALRRSELADRARTARTEIISGFRSP